MKKSRVEIMRCPVHPTYMAVVINDRRMTPSKCCGSWTTVKAWDVDSEILGHDFGIASLRARSSTTKKSTKKAKKSARSK